MAAFLEAGEDRTAEIAGNVGPHATGNIVFSANPANNSTITLNGSVITFATAPTASQVQIGADLPTTLQNLWFRER